MNNLIELKKQKYEELKEKLKIKYDENIDNINIIINALDHNKINDNDSLETIVFKKYLEFESVKKVADYINDLGYRVKTNSYIGQRKYISNDISEIIISDVDVEEDLKDIVKSFHEQHKIAMIKRHC